MLDEDTSFRRYFDGESDAVPQFYVNRLKRDLRSYWDFLPAGALNHDPCAYLKAAPRIPLAAAPGAAAGK